MSTNNWFNADVLGSVRMRINVIVVLMVVAIIYLQHEWILGLLHTVFN